MAERFENLDNILRDRTKEAVPKSLVDALNRYEKQNEEKTVSFLGNGPEKYSRSLTRQSSEIKSKTKLSLTLRLETIVLSRI